MILLLFLLVSLSEAASVSEEVKNAKVGENITLPCKAEDSSIIVVEWIKSDLGSAEYVLFYRDGQQDQTYQLSSFKGRVHLSESEVKKGDLSLTLTDVSSNDSGTYECRAEVGGSGRNKRAIIEERPIKTIKLQVSGSGSRGHAAMAATAAGFVLICSAVIAMFLFRKYKKQAGSRSEAAADEPEAEELA